MSALSQGAPGQQQAFVPAQAQCSHDGVVDGVAKKPLYPAQEPLTPEIWLTLKTPQEQLQEQLLSDYMELVEAEREELAEECEQRLEAEACCKELVKALEGALALISDELELSPTKHSPGAPTTAMPQHSDTGELDITSITEQVLEFDKKLKELLEICNMRRNAHHKLRTAYELETCNNLEREQENLKLADRLRELEPALGKNHALQQAKLNLVTQLGEEESKRQKLEEESRELRSRLREARLQGVHDRALISELLEAQHAQPTQCRKLEAFDACCQTDGEGDNQDGSAEEPFDIEEEFDCNWAEVLYGAGVQVGAEPPTQCSVEISRHATLARDVFDAEVAPGNGDSSANAAAETTLQEAATATSEVAPTASEVIHDEAAAGAVAATVPSHPSVPLASALPAEPAAAGAGVLQARPSQDGDTSFGNSTSPADSDSDDEELTFECAPGAICMPSGVEGGWQRMRGAAGPLIGDEACDGEVAEPDYFWRGKIA